MVKHIVLFKWKPEVSAERVAQHLETLKGLKDKFETITEMTIGENFSERSQGFQTGMVMTFTDRAALAAYRPHPDHQAAVDSFRADMEATLAVDYEHD